VTFASWILGAGLTATSSYVIVAIIASPALVELGLVVLVAHLIIFWVSQDANVTPPICVAAFAAASISGGKPMRTGFEAWKLARGLYIVPLLMAYSPLITGTLVEQLVVGGTGLVGIYGLSAGMAGWFRRRTMLFERGLLLAGGVMLIWPGWVTNAAGAVVLVAMWLLQRATPDKGPRHVRASQRAATNEELAAHAASSDGASDTAAEPTVTAPGDETSDGRPGTAPSDGDDGAGSHDEGAGR
jgi:TRAP-type uncharacterized transport system fused permease subunit